MVLYPPRRRWNNGMRCYRSDRPGLCLFCCYQPSCVVSQRSWFGFIFVSYIFQSYCPQAALNINVDFVDLRWGISDHDVHTGQALKVCMMLFLFTKSALLKCLSFPKPYRELIWLGCCRKKDQVTLSNIQWESYKANDWVNYNPIAFISVMVWTASVLIAIHVYHLTTLDLSPWGWGLQTLLH